MYKSLRILFTILATLCVAAVLPVGAFLGLTWALVLGLTAFLLYLLMIVCKHAQEAKEGLPQEENETEAPTLEETDETENSEQDDSNEEN